jgi:hypothetical protein
MPTTDFSLIVDGAPADVRALMCHFQQDPYPAGKRYQLRIRDTDVLSEAKKQFGVGARGNLERSKQSSFLTYLFPMIAMKCGQVALQFWANTIDRLEISDDELVLNGACSPHVGE